VKLRLVFLGKTRNPHLRALIDDYRKRIARFLPIEIEEWRSTAGSSRILAEVRGKQPRAPVILLDAAGQAYASEEFARWLGKQISSGENQLIFLLGGAEGFAEETKGKATVLLSLSKLTLPHELARVVLLEQLYRALASLHGHPYPK